MSVDLRAAEEEDEGDEEDYAEGDPAAPVVPCRTAVIPCAGVAVVAVCHGGR